MTDKKNMNEHSSMVDNIITVLLIDDEPEVAGQIRRMLTVENEIAFHYCQNPTVAIRMALKIKPTLILQDLYMPQMDGLKLIKSIRASEELKDVPLIVLVTKDETAIKAESLSLGANDYLIKIPDRNELIAKIKSLTGDNKKA
ncbi:response regulator [Bacteroidota bacterium]